MIIFHRGNDVRLGTTELSTMYVSNRTVASVVHGAEEAQRAGGIRPRSPLQPRTVAQRGAVAADRSPLAHPAVVLVLAEGRETAPADDPCRAGASAMSRRY